MRFSSFQILLSAGICALFSSLAATSPFARNENKEPRSRFVITSISSRESTTNLTPRDVAAKNPQMTVLANLLIDFVNESPESQWQYFINLSNMYEEWKAVTDRSEKAKIKLAMKKLEPLLAKHDAFVFEEIFGMLNFYGDLEYFWDVLEDPNTSVKESELIVLFGLLRHEGEYPARFVDRLGDVFSEKPLNRALFKIYLFRCCNEGPVKTRYH